MEPGTQLEIHHSPTRRSFEAIVEERLAHADYRMDGKRIIFTHTYVPRELEGRGIASQLAKVALEHARQEKLQVVPLCPFFSAYIRRHPEYQPLLAED